MAIQLEGEWVRIIPRVLVYSNGSNSVECTGGIVVNTKIVKFATANQSLVEPVDPAQLIRDPAMRRFDIVRESALGDAIVALTALRAVKKRLPHLNVALWTKDTWHELLRLQEEIPVLGSKPRIKGSTAEHFVMDFNGLYEVDHLPEGIKISRIERTLGPLDLENEPVDFSLPIPEKELAEAREFLPESEGPWVAVSVRRTNVGACRSPSEDLIARVCERLRSEGLGVYIVEGHDQIRWANAIGAKWRKRSSILETTAAIKLCAAIVTPDSGSMWMGHVTKIPIVALMGPTPGNVKCKHHALWPHGIRVIQTNDWIDCPACFEYEEACEWTSRCISKPDPDRFVRETVKGVQELVTCQKSASPTSGISPRSKPDTAPSVSSSSATSREQSRPAKPTTS